MSRFEPGIYARALQALQASVGLAETAPPPRDAEQMAVDIAAALCRRWEGCFLAPYLCPAGVPTIGYGATHYADGRPVTLNDPPITRDAAERLLLLMIRREYLPAVLRLCPALVRQTPERLAAIIDFTFNLGAGRLQASALRRRINAGEWEQVPAELRKWVIGGGKVLRGLVLRREAECALI